MDGEFLYLSNYLSEAKVPLRDVRNVGVLTVPVPLTKGLEELALKPFVVAEFQGRHRLAIASCSWQEVWPCRPSRGHTRS